MKLKSIGILFIVLICTTIDCRAESVTGSIRGVWLEHLDGSAEDISWILDRVNQAPWPTEPQGTVTNGLYSPDVVSKIYNLLQTYQAAGVNYIQFFVSDSFIDNYCNQSAPGGTHYLDDASYCRDYSYPTGGTRIYTALNNFIHLLSSGPYAGKFHIAFMITTQTTSPDGSAPYNYFCDSIGGTGDTTGFAGTRKSGANTTENNACSDDGDPDWTHVDYIGNLFSHPFGKAEEFLNNMIFNVAMANDNVGIVLLAPTMQPCNNTGCDGDAGANALANNNGEWLKAVWAWEQQTFPNLIVSYENKGIIQSTSPPMVQLQQLYGWESANTPGMPYLVASLYVVQEPVGSPPSTYNSATQQAINSYTGSTPLWIDEYGMSIPSGYTMYDQQNAINGYLAGATCMSGTPKYPKFLWTAGNDGPNNFGLVYLFNADDTPSMQIAWTAVSQWYNADSSIVSTSVIGLENNYYLGILAGTCVSGGAPTFSLVSGPSHGTVGIDSSTGYFSYTPSTNFWGTDSFTYGIGDGSSKTATIRVTPTGALVAAVSHIMLP